MAAVVGAAELVRVVVAWCDLSGFHDGPYEGPNHPCPNNGTWQYCTQFGEDHYLRPRRVWMCPDCEWAYLQDKKPESHNCAEAT